MAGTPRDHLSPDDLDGAMRAAFGGTRRDPGVGPESVLDSIERLHGARSRVLLHDEVEAPIVRPAPPELDDVRYQIIGEIATGGVGVVFHGRDRDLGREVAVKVLRPEHAGKPDIVARFLEEAQIGGQLQHPGIVPVYSPGLQRDGRPYFTMKLVRGRTLAALLRERGNRGDLVRVFEQVCHTIAYAHSRGVIHRDLKPSNVMVGSFGEVQVVDWGFGKVLGRREPQHVEGDDPTVVATVRSRDEGSGSITGSVIGTPAYMPPEQALGRLEELDERADVFALGGILCEILTGEPPYSGRKRDLVVKAAQARLDEAHGRLDACGADEELVQLCRRCLAAVPEERPADAGVVADEVRRYFAAAEERARNAELEAVEERARLERRRAHAAWARRAKRKTRWIAASLLLAVVAGGGIWFVHESRRRTRADAARPSFERALERSAVDAARGEWEPALAKAREALALARANGLREERAAEAVRRAESGRDDARRRAAEAAERTRLAASLEALRLRGDEAAYRTALGPLLAGGLPAQLDTPEMRERIGAALDHWAALADANGGLLEAARRIDPHPFRDEVRAAASRTGRLQDLADAADVARLDPRSIDALALLLPGEGGRQLLERALRAHPGDFWLNHHLSRRAAPEQAVCFRQAALALRPDLSK